MQHEGTGKSAAHVTHNLHSATLHKQSCVSKLLWRTCASRLAMNRLLLWCFLRKLKRRVQMSTRSGSPGVALLQRTCSSTNSISISNRSATK
jgi:hypothetical protein